VQALDARLVVPDRLDHQVRAQTAGRLQHRLDERPLGDVDGHVGAELLRDPQPRRRLVGDHHRREAGAARQLGEEQARRPGAADRGGQPRGGPGDGLRPEPAHRVHGGAELLGHQQPVEIRAVRERHQRPARDDLPLGEAPRVQRYGRDEHGVPGGETGGAGLLDDPDALVSGEPRRRRERAAVEPVEDDVQVAAADRAAVRADQHLVMTELRDRDLDRLQPTRCDELHCPHGIS
jgi:hypothetical protein